jgi:hypothetical protein
MITQGPFGEIKKEWVFDRTIAGNATPVGGAGSEQIKPEMFLQYENKLVARSKSDIRMTSKSSQEALTNILITLVSYLVKALENKLIMIKISSIILL